MREDIIYRQVGRDMYYKTWHRSDKSMIIYTYSDGGSIVCGEGIYPIKKGTLCFIGSQKYHYTMPDDSERYVRSKLFISSEALGRVLGLLSEYTSFKNIFNEDSVVYAYIGESEQENVERIFEELYSYEEEKYLNAMFYSCFMKLLVCLDRNIVESVSSPSKGMQKAIEYINRNVCENIGIDEICSALHVSKYHFCRQFKSKTGMTVMEYILKTRIVMAKNMLLKEDISITEISYRCGFSSISYFSRMFKKDTGMTPLAYRKRRFD